MRTIVHVDGFNLHCGCLKNSPWKWLAWYHCPRARCSRNMRCCLKVFSGKPAPEDSPQLLNRGPATSAYALRSRLMASSAEITEKFCHAQKYFLTFAYFYT